MSDIKITPQISVVMSVYNAEKYLVQAIDSILNQTFTDFEFIIINDASTDTSLDIIHSYHDVRINLINKPFNKGFKGFVENLNIGLDLAKGKYIARMDADDIAREDRFQIQYDFLEKNPEIFMIGSDLNLINENNQNIGYLKSFANHQEITRKFNAENALYHPVIFFRNETDIRYRDKFKACEDFDFYLQLLSNGKKFRNITQPLLDYRILESSISRSESGFSKRLLMEISKDFFVSRMTTKMDNYDELDDQIVQKILNKDFNVTVEELTKGLEVALLYNYDYYDLIYKKLAKQDKTTFFDSIFLNKSLRAIHSKINLKLHSRFGKITTNL